MSEELIDIQNEIIAQQGEALRAANELIGVYEDLLGEMLHKIWY